MYYVVTVEQGHQGCGNCSYLKFAFEAKTLLDAVDMARKMPSVKHSKLCVNAKQVDYDEYLQCRNVNSYHVFETYAPVRKKKNWRR